MTTCCQVSKTFFGELLETSEDLLDLVFACASYSSLAGHPEYGKYAVGPGAAFILAVGAIRYKINLEMQRSVQVQDEEQLHSSSLGDPLFDAPQIKINRCEKPYLLMPAIAQALLDANALLYVILQKGGKIPAYIALPFFLINGAAHGAVIYGAGAQSLKQKGKKSTTEHKGEVKDTHCLVRALLSLPALFESVFGYVGGTYNTASNISGFFGASPTIGIVVGSAFSFMMLVSGAVSTEHDKVSSKLDFLNWERGYNTPSQISNGWFGRLLETLFKKIFFPGYLLLRRCVGKAHSANADNYYKAKWWGNLLPRIGMMIGFHINVLNALLQTFYDKPEGYELTWDDSTVPVGFKIAAIAAAPVVLILAVLNASMEMDAYGYRCMKKALPYGAGSTDASQDTFDAMQAKVVQAELFRPAAVEQEPECDAYIPPSTLSSSQGMAAV